MVEASVGGPGRRSLGEGGRSAWRRWTPRPFRRT